MGPNHLAVAGRLLKEKRCYSSSKLITSTVRYQHHQNANNYQLPADFGILRQINGILIVYHCKVCTYTLIGISRILYYKLPPVMKLDCVLVMP